MRSPLKIVPLTKDKEQIWEDFVEDSSCTNMFHLVGWKAVFEKVFGFTHYYLMAEDGIGDVSGILPMFLMKDIFRRKYLISNPFSSFAGICVKTQEATEALLKKSMETAKETQARYVEFRQMNMELPYDLPARQAFVTLILDLPEDSEQIWNAIASRNRNKIRKAEKNGLQVDFGMQYLKDFYAIYAKNLRFLGTPVFPFTMFETIAEVFANRCELLVLKLEGRPVSGMFLFRFKNILSEPWVASLRQYNKIYINNYLYWQAIKYACENRFKKFDFGRSTIDSGTYQFKLQWGAKPIPLHYQYYLNKSKEIPIVDAHNNKYQKMIDVWKKLPLSFTNFMGPKVVKFLPEY